MKKLKVLQILNSSGEWDTVKWKIGEKELYVTEDNVRLISLEKAKEKTEDIENNKEFDTKGAML